VHPAARRQELLERGEGKYGSLGIEPGRSVNDNEEDYRTSGVLCTNNPVALLNIHTLFGASTAPQSGQLQCFRHPHSISNFVF
jgi:hypothetical protein